ncbi:cyclin-like protein [Gigaspora rosea]|uniref:Cyclin-like protein n=1 Tax=Gigaspora rosea TaxID=44941 RepID=A0A397VVD8_9GLOM|nr:cyclin-like protein [Gigaspora rosea]CAG8498525.1 11752_t:CDS:2 [Gigaspora rosea]
MAANFWASSHGKQWLLSRQQLQESRKEDLKYINTLEMMKVNIWFAKLMTDLGNNIGVRQVIIATALTNSYRGTDPYLVAATCMYLACKIEESPHHIKSVIAEMKTVTQDKGGFQYENHKVAEMEFYLLEELNFNMIVFHPYRALTTLAQDLGTKNEDVQRAWFIVNDTYKTDMCLLYPPYVIAAAALYLPIALKGGGQYGDNSTSNDNSAQGVVTRGAKKGATNDANNNGETTKVKDIRQWFALLNVDLDQIIDIVQEIISLYEVWDEYNKNNKKHQEIHGILQRLLKK